jgi:Ser/Thr protein kinase RdoA (MazF antagonist)
VVQHVPVPFVDTPLTSNVREAVERDWSTNLNGPAVRLYGGEESAAFRVGDVVIRIGPAWRQLAELEWCHAVATAAAASVREAIAPRVNTRGEMVGLVDGRPVSVWPFIEGQWADDDGEQQCSQAPVLPGRHPSRARRRDRRPAAGAVGAFCLRSRGRGPRTRQVAR